MASPLHSHNSNAQVRRPDIAGIQQDSNVHSPGSWQYQLTESMLMHNTGYDIPPSIQESRPSEEHYQHIDNEKPDHQPHIEVYPPPRDEHETDDIKEITTPQRFGSYIDRRFEPIGKDGRPHRPMRAFSEYEEDSEPSAPLVPRGSLMFLFGFICPPVWWIGAFYPFTCLKSSQTRIPKIERRWRSANRVMALFSILLIAVLLGMMGWYISKYHP